MTNINRVTCPCGSGRTYSECCQLLIDGTHLAPTPEALMRSRYTAYTQANIAYIAATMQGVATQHFDAIQAQRWAQSVNWQSLKVLACSAVTGASQEGTVEFIACYEDHGTKHFLHEVSKFQRLAGKWYYTDGYTPTTSPPPNPNQGRNERCKWGSGKKYKICCGR